MCGFAGLLQTQAPASWRPEDCLRAMVGSLDHRGPDDKGHWCDDSAGVYLGFRRLAILDLSAAGHQPMVSPSGRFVIVFNGEVYNFQDLRDELRAVGFAFRGGSDTEVLLAAFEHWGVERSVPRFRGMFAFAVWDAQERRLWLARDRMGIKPLYILVSNGGVAFGSEARVFHHCPLYDGQGDTAVADSFLQRLYVGGEASILRGVRKVRPGEIVEFALDGSTPTEGRRTRFWDLGQVRAEAERSPLTDPREVVEQLHALLRESVRLRLIADVPVGGFLSGGIDSSLVVAIMQELASGPVRTFTISFDDPDFDEAHFASSVARHIGTDHTCVEFPTSEVASLLPTLPQLSDEPMANPSLLPTLLVSRVARRDVVVALSGDGGDELFGGYNRYLHGARLIRLAAKLPRPARSAIAAVLATDAGTAAAGLGLRLARPKNAGKQQSVEERLAKTAGVLRARTQAEGYASLMRIGWSRSPFSNGNRAVETAEFKQWGQLEADMMFVDQMGYLPDDLLTKVDRASMWESLEARVPILDHRVVEFSWRVPAHLKIHHGVTKQPLRTIAERYVPKTLLDRPKMGFTVPIAKWLTAELRDWARDTLGPANSRLLPLWDRRTLERAWKDFERGRQDLALPLWAAAVFQGWSDAWNVRFDPRT